MKMGSKLSKRKLFLLILRLIKSTSLPGFNKQIWKTIESRNGAYFLAYALPMVRWGTDGWAVHLHTVFRLRVLGKLAILSMASEMTLGASALWSVHRRRGNFRRGCACQPGKGAWLVLTIRWVSPTSVTKAGDRERACSWKERKRQI